MNRWIGGRRGRSAARYFSLVCGLVSFALWSQAVHARDCPSELPVNTTIRSSPLPDNRLFAVNFGGESRQVLLHWDDVPTNVGPTEGVPELANQLIERVEAYLKALASQGFRIPPGAGHPCVQGKLLRLYLYQAPTGKKPEGFSSGNRFDVVFSEASAARKTILEDAMPALQQEIFSSVQGQYRIGAMNRKWFSDGTAALVAASLGDVPARHDLVLNDICRLREKTARVDRPSCPAEAFWRYLSGQLTGDAGHPGQSAALIHELYEFLESYRGLRTWQSAATDHIHGSGDFDGDGREELLVTSATHLGLLASTQAQSRVLAVSQFGHLLEGQWNLKASDQILGIGDFNADGKDEFFIRNGGFIALLGAGPGGTLRVIADAPLGSAAFSDWRPAYRDQLIAIGDFNGDGTDEAMFRGRSRVGLIGLDQANQFVSPMSTSFGRLVRRLGRNPGTLNVVGVGDIDGNGRDEILARDGRGLFVWGVNAEYGHQLMFDVDYGERVGGGWLIDPDDSFLAIRDLDGTVNDEDDNPGLRAEIVVTSSTSLGVIGMNAFSRVLETKAIRALSAGTRLMAVGSLLGSSGDQLVLRDRNTLSVLEYSYESPSTGVLRTAASLTTPPATLSAIPRQRGQRLERGPLKGRFNIIDRSFIRDVTGATTAALTGSSGSYLIVRGVDRQLYFRVAGTQDDAGIVTRQLSLEHSEADGLHQKSLVEAVNAFVEMHNQ